MQLTSTIVKLSLVIFAQLLLAVSVAQGATGSSPWPLQDSNYARPITERALEPGFSNDASRHTVYAQSQQAKLRSRSEVIAEVKRRYNAEVLKISLAKSGQVYRVRILMPNGKVKNIQVKAQR